MNVDELNHSDASTVVLQRRQLCSTTQGFPLLLFWVVPPTDGELVLCEKAAHGQRNTILMHGPVSRVKEWEKEGRRVERE